MTEKSYTLVVEYGDSRPDADEVIVSDNEFENGKTHTELMLANFIKYIEALDHCGNRWSIKTKSVTAD